MQSSFCHILIESVINILTLVYFIKSGFILFKKKYKENAMNSEIYNIVKGKITTNNLVAYKAQIQKMKEAAKNEVGTLFYDFFINEKEKEFLIIEKYTNGEAFMKHMKKFSSPEYILKLLTMQEMTSVEIPGVIIYEMKVLFTKNGRIYKDYPINL